ncbi:MAG: DUF2029 domain-containing protein [Ruminococcus sp.]|nr:DUF2029 domain-containing protein [Ruminococcus sp.]
MNKKTTSSLDEASSRLASACFLFLTIAFGLLARKSLLPMGSGDQSQFLKPWFRKINELGAAGTLRDGIGDYMPPYFWIMIIINALPIKNKMYGLKWVSSIADFVAAVFVMKIVKKVTGSDTKAELSFAAAFLMPSVLLDSAGWGQCDSIFTMFLVMCVYYLIQGRDVMAVTCFSLSFIFKLQAIFLAPLLMVMVLKRKVRLRALVAFPIVYLAAILPSAACGHEFSSLFTIYFSQAGQYSTLNMTLPNIWAMMKGVGGPKGEMLGKAGVMLAGVSCMTLIYYLFRREQTPGVRGTVVLAALSALFVPYLLPYMHERYFYTATVIGLVLVFVDKRLTPVWLVIEFSSCTSMAHFLLGKEELDLRFSAFLVTAALIVLFVYYCSLAEKDEEIELVPMKSMLELLDDEEDDEKDEEAEETEKTEEKATEEAAPQEEKKPDAPTEKKTDTNKAPQPSKNNRRGKKRRTDPIQERHGKGVKL